MVNFYFIQVKLGNITVEEVPSIWREQVKAMLDE